VICKPVEGSDLSGPVISWHSPGKVPTAACCANCEMKIAMKTNSVLQVVCTLSLAALLTSSVLAQPRSPARNESVRIYDSRNRTVITNADSRTQVLTYTRGGRRVIEVRQIQPSTQRFEFNPGYRASESVMRNERPTTTTPETDLQMDPATGNVGPITLFSIPF
jgi:hypothetical protein